MQTILVVGEGECAAEIARELVASGYQVEAKASLDASDAVDAKVAALIVCASSSVETDGLARLREGVGEKPPVLAVLPEEALGGQIDFPADDLAFYPLRPRELGTRVRRLIGWNEGTESPDVLRQGALAIDTASYKLYVDGTPVELTFKEYELLRFLATHPDRVYSREALLDKVWGYDYFGGARTVDVHIRRIRSKIERDSFTFIETVRSVGYRFHASS